MDELLQFLGLGHYLDVDFELHGAALSELRYKCSLPKASFAVAGCVMAGFHKARLLEDNLLTDSKGSPRFRYCPVCLKQRRSGYLDIHWRFVDWRYCPDHNCLMEDSCWKCEARICYPRDMALSKAGREGSASQRLCLMCRADLAAAVPCVIDPVSSTAVNELEACWLLNGRALLASLCRGKATYRAEGLGMAELGHRAQLEWLPTPAQWSPVEHRIRSFGQSGDAHATTAQGLRFHELKTPWGSAMRIDRR